MKHYEYEINLFVDGEPAENVKTEMFSHLSDCTECRSLLSDLITLKEKSRVYCSENLSQIKNKPKPASRFYKIAFYASTAAAILLLFLLVTAKPTETFVTKNEVRVDTVFVQKEIPIAQNQLTKNSSSTPGKKGKKSNAQKSSYLAYIISLKTEQVTFADIVSSN